MRLRTEVEHYRSRLQEAERELREARERLEAITSARSWRLVMPLRRFYATFVRGSWGERWAYLHDGVARVVRPSAYPSDAAFGRRLEAFLGRVAQCADSDRFVVMFSGTTHIQEQRGNRPMRLTTTLRERGIPVLFSYYRYDTGEPIPLDRDPLLLQSPIDRTLAHLHRIARFPLAGKRRLFIVSFPHLACARWVNVLNSLGWATLYDCRDDWEEFHKVGAADWYGEEIESYLVSNCDATTATSRALRRKMQSYASHRTVHLSPNALDTAFVSPANRGRTAPRDGPEVIGYFGHLTARWFDWDAVCEVARSEPTWRFEIIGHGLESALDLPANVRLLGPRGHSQINQLARTWRAAIIPFRPGKLTDAVDPIKVYEYLALGIPVVSLKMEQIESYPYVFTAADPARFRERIREAMSAPIDRSVLDAFLAANRWQDRADQILSVWDVASQAPDPLSVLAGSAAAG